AREEGGQEMDRSKAQEIVKGLDEKRGKLEGVLRGGIEEDGIEGSRGPRPQRGDLVRDPDTGCPRG
ncbi:MAG: hypothetical protein ACP5G6_08915, partial [Conexivisphaera sp.]